MGFDRKVGEKYGAPGATQFRLPDHFVNAVQAAWHTSASRVAVVILNDEMNLVHYNAG
jgi:hypothetical protein